MKVKEILNLESKELEEMMTEEQFDKMQKLGLQYIWQLLDMMQDGVRQSGMNDDEEYTTIDEYLNYIEDMRDVD